MKKLRWLTTLMIVTLLVVTGFQVYWLSNNYEREKRTLAIKSNFLFQQSVRSLQVEKMKLIDVGDSSHKSNVRVFVSEDHAGDDLRIKGMPDEQIITTINALTSKLRDSIHSRVNQTLITLDNRIGKLSKDSIPKIFSRRRFDQNDNFRFLYGIDSLQDSLRLPEISAVYKQRLKEEAIQVPFSITRKNTVEQTEDPGIPDITIGLAHPVTYHLELGNTFPFILKKLTLPILFSIFLVGVTVLSFLLFYRNLLKQQRLAEIKNEFISNITHELKTPIATVGVAIEALRNFNAMDDPRKTKEYLDISSNELQRLSLLVDKVLKLSMFEKKQIELRYEPLNFKTVIEEVTNSMRLQLEKNHATVTITDSGDLNIQGDHLHLQSVVFNLLDNALKYKQDGNTVILINLREEAGNIVAEITDNGIGISQEYKDKIFDKFFRVPAGDTHNAKGYGLGLSYVSHVIQKHKGAITVESQSGIGTKFIITLPKQKT